MVTLTASERIYAHPLAPIPLSESDTGSRRLPGAGTVPGNVEWHGRQIPARPDHLHVQRRSLYYHHGIYVGDNRVIQFGSGVSIVNKRAVGINAVPLRDFEQDGTATAVRHGYHSRSSTGWHPPADESWKVIERAEFLLKLQPRLPYDLIGQPARSSPTCASAAIGPESLPSPGRYFTVRRP